MNAHERQAKLDTQKQQLEGQKHRVWARGEWHSLDIWQVPVDGLALNIDNRRFAADRKIHELKLGRSLDPESRPDDEKSIISILLDANWQYTDDQVVGRVSKDAKSLKDDWLRRGQETPFWIRPDGTVRNGNRRLAMIRRLREEQGDEGLQYVDAVILKWDEFPESDLFEMEQHEQLTDNQKINYTDINRLLTIRDAANLRGIDWGDPESIKRVAGQIQHLTRGNMADAAVQLRAIRAMEAFLSDSDSPGDYEKAFGSVESFRDIGRNMQRLEPDLVEFGDEMLRVCFAALRARLPHGKIRGLWRVFRNDRPAFDALVRQVDGVEDEWRETGGGGLGEPDLSEFGEVASEDEDEDSLEDSLEGEEAEAGPVVPNYPKVMISSLITNAVDAEDSKKLDVVDAIQQALSRLSPVVPSAPAFTEALAGPRGSVVREMIDEIATWVDSARASGEE